MAMIELIDVHRIRHEANFWSGTPSARSWSRSASVTATMAAAPRIMRRPARVSKMRFSVCRRSMIGAVPLG
jgi:hypothetical protein